ncbi:uncharacterized protein LOC121991687 isoform X1 [Zingiber officinale]|uniref:uncharacterized protein LOC121991687 isoform X1 n=1 Tax=Zingiber officinale TaxID=94328 RepID=UPI001C4D9C75|nr:uncharacterized protein LOC121991687 isoform X1 [Zingiber officinale]
MEANSSEAKNAHLLPLPLTPRSPKRLLFDNRYGWIFDEWKDPSEEAYAGGRGMFCILPIAKSLVNAASHSALHRLRPLATLHIFRPRLLSCNHWNHIDLAIKSVGRAIQSPDQFSPHELRANLSNQFAKLTPCALQWNLNLMNLGKNNHPNDTENPTKSVEGDPTK